MPCLQFCPLITTHFVRTNEAHTNKASSFLAFQPKETRLHTHYELNRPSSRAAAVNSHELHEKWGWTTADPLYWPYKIMGVFSTKNTNALSSARMLQTCLNNAEVKFSLPSASSQQRSMCCERQSCLGETNADT